MLLLLKPIIISSKFHSSKLSVYCNCPLYMSHILDTQGVMASMWLTTRYIYHAREIFVVDKIGEFGELKAIRQFYIPIISFNSILQAGHLLIFYPSIGVDYPIHQCLTPPKCSHIQHSSQTLSHYGPAEWLLSTELLNANNIQTTEWWIEPHWLK